MHFKTYRLFQLNWIENTRVLWIVAEVFNVFDCQSFQMEIYNWKSEFTGNYYTISNSIKAE